MEENQSDATLKTRSELRLGNVDVENLPENILFPDELNRYLKDQIQYLKYENAMLRKNNTENEETIKKLEAKKSEPTKSKHDFLMASQVATTKIVELTKKLREKNCEVESLKTKCAKLEAALVSSEVLEKEEVVEEKPKNELEEQIRKLQEKVNSTTIKYMEIKNCNVQLKNEVKGMKKVLQQEVGDNFESLINNPNNTWRGRAQVILELQQKNMELREKLKNRKFTETSSIDFENKIKTESKLSVLSKENLDMKNENEEMAKKLNALKMKNKLLETDYALIKSKLNIANEKLDKDKEIIDDLKAELHSNKEFRTEEWKTKDKTIKKLKSENENLHSEIHKYKVQLEKTNALLEEKNKEVEKLKNDFVPQFKIHAVTKNDGKTMGRLEAERIRLLELIDIGNTKLNSLRDNLEEIQQQLRFEKQRSAKLESSLARLELDQNQGRSGYSNLTPKGVETRLKDDLTLAQETIKALKTRIDIERQERKADFIEFSKILQNREDNKL